MAEELLEGEVESLFPTPGLHMQYVRCRGCDRTARVNVSTTVQPAAQPLAVCPDCHGEMWWDFNQSCFSFTMPARDYSATKLGMRRKNSMIKQGERLQRSQWDQVKPMPLAEGGLAVNPTPGGVYDPKGPFVRPDTNRVIVTGINK